MLNYLKETLINVVFTYLRAYFCPQNFHIIECFSKKNLFSNGIDLNNDLPTSTDLTDTLFVHLFGGSLGGFGG